MKLVDLIPIAALFALAACQPPSNPNAADPGELNVEAADIEVVPPSENAAPAVASSEAPVTIIPAAFHGRWGMVPADCTSTRGDAKGLMVIAADSIRFFESVARPAALTLVGDRRIDGNYSATGEGQSWTLLQQLSLSADGKTMTRIVDEGDSAPSPGGNRFTYQRCA
jgi:hypothetical protein